MSNIYCPRCGAMSESSARFCNNCGAVLPAAQQPAPPTEVAAPPPVYDPYRPPSSLVPVGARRPGKVTAINILALVSAGFSLLIGLGWLFTLCLAPLGIYAIVVAVFEIMYAVKALPEPPRVPGLDRRLGILQIVNIISGNIVSLVAGILTLVFMEDPEVQAYYGVGRSM